MKVSDHLDRSCFQGAGRENPMYMLKERMGRERLEQQRGVEASETVCFNFDERKKTTGVSFAHQKTTAHVAKSLTPFLASDG